MTVNLFKDVDTNLTEKEVNCTATSEATPEVGKPSLVNFECNAENLDTSINYTGLELVASEEINGIPEEPDLLNPVKVDELIVSGEIKNYTLDEYKKFRIF